MKLDFILNGNSIFLEIKADELLVDVLREQLGLMGTKASCREGECGSCTVWLDGQPINSCILPAAKIQGRVVTTIEGLGTSELPHRVQEAIAEFGASQCGYCTPGFVMAAAALLRDNPAVTDKEIIEGLSGNLCRCTGYTRIVSAVKAVVNPHTEIPIPEQV